MRPRGSQLGVTGPARVEMEMSGERWLPLTGEGSSGFAYQLQESLIGSTQNNYRIQ